MQDLGEERGEPLLERALPAARTGAGERSRQGRALGRTGPGAASAEDLRARRTRSPAVFDRLSQGGELPPGIDASAAATLTFRIAERFRHIGRWDMADKTLALLIERYPG